MKRSPLNLFVPFSLMLALLLPGPIVAGKGRSYSSGGSSFSRGSASSFHRSSSGGSPSFRSSGRSYSSGGSSKIKSAPSASSSKPHTGAKPSRPSFDSAAAAAQRKQVSKKSFDIPRTPPSGGRISPQGRSFSAGPPTPTVTPGGRSYSVGSSKSSPSVKRSTGSSFDSAAAAAQRREASKAAFTQGTKPRTAYTTSSGETRRIDVGDKRVEAIRRNTDPGRWATREQRRRQVFSNPSPPVVIYQDPYSNWFWWWLLTRDRNTRALWAYHHQSDMDAARYRDLLAKDQRLEARIRELEAKQVPRDPVYVPPEVDPDLMYDNGFVEAAVNPQPPPPPSPSLRLPQAVWNIVLILAGMFFFVWLVFIKRWGGN